jgi:hypothetical protein
MWPLLFIATQLGDPEDVPPPPPPGDPVQLAAPYDYDVEVVGTDQLNHTWTAVPNATGYSLEGWNGSAWIGIQLLGSGVTSYNETGLDAKTFYERRLIATGDTLNYLDSEEVYRSAVTDDTTTAIEQVVEDYLTISGATNPQKTAFRTFIQSAITHGYDEDLLIMYPFAIGSSLANKMYNVLDPEDLDSAYRAEVLTVTNDAKGIKIPTANVNALETNVYPDDLIGTPKIGVAYYLKLAAQHLIRNDDSTMFIIHYANSDGKSYPNIAGSSFGTPFSGSNAAGLVNVIRTDFDTVKVRLNGTERASDPKHIDPITSPETSGTYLPNTSIKFYSSIANQIVSFFCVHRVTDDTRLALMDADIIQLMTDLGANV